MGKLPSSVDINKISEYFAEYSFPYIVLNEDNVICDANEAFLNELNYSEIELLGKKKITDISISASKNSFGVIKSSEFLNKKNSGISDFIALKNKSGKLKYFLFQVRHAGKGKKIIFLFNHSKHLNKAGNINSEISLNSSADAFPEATVFFNSRFIIIDINVSGDVDLIRLFNLGVGKKIEDSIAPASLKKLSVDTLKNCRKTGKKAVFEYALEINEKQRYYRFRVIPYESFIVALVSDITAEKQALQKLIDNQQELQEVIDEMPVAVLLANTQGKIVFRNSPFIQLIKRAGLNVTDDICEYIGSELFSDLKFNETEKHTCCVQIGKLFVDVSSRKHNKANKAHHIVSFVDVTDREKAKNALEASYKKHKVIVETSPNGIMIRDFNKLYYANPEALRILGFKKSSEVQLKNVLRKEDLASINERLLQVQSGGEVEYMEYMITPADTKKPISIITKPILIDYQGKQAFQIVFRNNSTEKLLMEERLKKQLLEAHNKKLKAEIARRIDIENKLKKTIDENKILINEVHHRVKNNYQIISSMLNRCTTNISDPASIKAISAVKNRLVSMAIVNDFYMDAENYNSIMLVDYLKKIYQNFIRENGSAYTLEKIVFKTKLRDVVVDLNDAVPIGLIFNEILTILFQLVDKLSDNFCNFVSLKWQNKTNLMFTVRFHDELAGLLEQKFEHSAEKVSLTDLLEQMDGYMECHFEKAELQLIVKLSKIN
ncbi:MAG: hypothetical protein A2W93_09145 [Bacteroidetes bacterium GWF2_43_63]|nr:MAG: hypothetical protein A2W94_05525 [Bacteroidetes bacterium GWE2_42_42]OFY54462.1 MAG: hypothetical protein A2W93_09145 [Bacteroidetes bacterium GWF2_43_63]HBG70410.1 hypothetical protein [Bacteroidales bacterium]HCB63473.1 hypothetical protein [Bacteroidales bacterium]